MLAPDSTADDTDDGIANGAKTELLEQCPGDVAASGAAD
jgi:hypothetical protein